MNTKKKLMLLASIVAFEFLSADNTASDKIKAGGTYLLDVFNALFWVALVIGIFVLAIGMIMSEDKSRVGKRAAYIIGGAIVSKIGLTVVTEMMNL